VGGPIERCTGFTKKGKVDSKRMAEEKKGGRRKLLGKRPKLSIQKGTMLEIAIRGKTNDLLIEGQRIK